MQSQPGRRIPRRTLLRSIGGAAAGVGAAGLGVGIGTAHETPTPDERIADSEGDSRTPDSVSYEPLSTLSLPGTKELVTSADGTTGYAAVTDGYATVDLSALTQPTVLAERRDLLADRENGPLRQVHDVNVDDDRLLVVGPANAVPEGLNAAILVDVGDPADPRQIAVHETDFPIHNCLLRDGYAYLTGNGATGNPLVILDVRDGIEEIGRWSLFDHDDRWRDVHSSLRTLHDVWVTDDIAYLAQWDAGTWLLDVSDPAAPEYLSDVGSTDVETLSTLDRQGARRESLTPPGNSHYVATNADGTVLAVGEETWAVDGGATGGPCGIDLYDCADPTAPTRLASIEPPPSPNPTSDGLWTTAHNFELDGDVLYSSWYRGGVKRHDITDPAEPREVAWWRNPRETSFWTARTAVSGEYFVAADMSVSGARSVAPEAGIYLFPDRGGTQSPPPEPALTGSFEHNSTLTPTPSSESASTPSSEGTLTSTPTSTTDDESSAARTPGFGVGSAFLALGVAAWSRLRRCESDD